MKVVFLLYMKIVTNDFKLKVYLLKSSFFFS